MSIYRVQFIHKIAPRDTDVESADIPDGAFSDSRTLARALRDAGMLVKGSRVRGFRAEGNRVIVFPDRGIWHSLTLTHEER
jgi:hypothetical protein